MKRGSKESPYIVKRAATGRHILSGEKQSYNYPIRPSLFTNSVHGAFQTKQDMARRYVPSIVMRDIQRRTSQGKGSVRRLGEYGDVEFEGACAFFDISGFSKLASRLGRREKEETAEEHRAQKRRTLASSDHSDVKLVRDNSLIGKVSMITKKGIMLSRTETIARQHEASLELLPRILGERRGMGAETLALAIKELFGKLVDRIELAGGDIIKFAGDALICVWSDESTPVGVLVYHAIQCGFELSTHVENISLGRLETSGPASSLHMHVSVGSGSMRLVNVGGESRRWEFWVCGDGVTRACDGVDLSKPGEIVVCRNSYFHLERTLKKAAKMTGETLQRGHPIEGGKYHMLTALDAPVPPMRRKNNLQIKSLDSMLAYCPVNVQRAVLNSSANEDSIRDVCTVFLLFRGMEHLNKSEHIGKVDSIFRSLQRSIYAYGGILRQFVVDDKGAVAVIIVGFPYFHFPVAEQASRGVNIALHARSSMRSLNIQVQCGVTTGTVFCGNVGNTTTRCEYAAVGADVNLSARFMGKDKQGKILVDGRTAEAASSTFRFTALEKTLTLKGVEGPVQAFYPVGFARRNKSTTNLGSLPLHDVVVYGREDIIDLCRTEMQASSKGLCIVLLGDSGIGKTTVLRSIVKSATEDHGIFSIMTIGMRSHLAVPFYPWRKIFMQLLMHVAGSKYIHLVHLQPAIDNYSRLFMQSTVEYVGDTGQSDEEVSEECKFVEMCDSIFNQYPHLKEHQDAISIIFPILSTKVQESNVSEVMKAKQDFGGDTIDGMVCSHNQFQQVKDLLAALMTEVVQNKSDSLLVALDDVDMFDRHSLLLLYFMKDAIPSNVSFLVTSSASSQIDARQGQNNDDEMRGTELSIKSTKFSVKSGCFPFPFLNFLHERQHFLLHSVFSTKNKNDSVNMRIHSLPSIPTSSASAVFKHHFKLNFDDTIISKALALSSGNLKLAHSFLEKCIDAGDIFTKEFNVEYDAYVRFSDKVTNGSVKLPWGSELVTTQLENMDSYTRELAQILSVLGVDVSLKAILCIDILFRKSDNSRISSKRSKLSAQKPERSKTVANDFRVSIRRVRSTPAKTKPDIESRAGKIQKALDKLVASEILVCLEATSLQIEAGGIYTQEWGFATSQIRAAVYTSMTYNIRQEIHETLTRYYRLAYQNDLSHFASIICYHAEAAGHIKVAVRTSLSAASLQIRNRAYRSALSNIQRCIGLLENRANTEADHILLVGCLMREAHIYIAIDDLTRALNSLSVANLVCAPSKRNLIRKFSCCLKKSRLQKMKSVVSRCKSDLNKVIDKQGGSYDELASEVISKLGSAYIIESELDDEEPSENFHDIETQIKHDLTMRKQYPKKPSKRKSVAIGIGRARTSENSNKIGGEARTSGKGFGGGQLKRSLSSGNLKLKSK